MSDHLAHGTLGWVTDKTTTADPEALGGLARLRANGAYDRFVRRSEYPMLALSAVYLAVLVIPILDTGLSVAWRAVLNTAGVVVWVLFGIEYVVRLLLAPDRRHFVVHNLLDLVVVAVPVLRPARLARLARFARLGALAGEATRRGHGRLHVAVAVQVLSAAMIVIFVGSVGMFDVERGAPGANIHTFGDALWWALGTVTTVGYGDKYPVTTDGRLIAAAVMLTGIAVAGIVTASVATWFVARLRGIETEEHAEAARAERLEAALAEALARLARLEAHLGSAPEEQSLG